MIRQIERPQIVFPVFYDKQVELYKLHRKHRYVAAQWGRRSGKTDVAKVIAVNAAVDLGHTVGWFAPSYKTSSEAFVQIARTMGPAKDSSNKIEGVIRAIPCNHRKIGGRIDFWSLEDDRAARGRGYNLVIIDEAAFTRPNMMDMWELNIEPTLIDFNGKALVLSNANGNNKSNFFYQICEGNRDKYGFVVSRGPTWQNPHVPERMVNETHEQWTTRRDAYFAHLKATKDPLVFAQEYEAEFIDWSGKALFDIRNMLDENKQAFDIPDRCDYVFATIDSATKTGKKHDGTAVSMWAFSSYAPNGRNLILLDWDIVQISGDLLINWLPTVFQTLDMYAGQCGARVGSFGAYIEDAASGMILLQQAKRMNYPVEAIDSKLTSVGKTERALNVSGHVYCKSVGISKHAHDKRTMYHENMLNHWESQVGEFKVGDTDPLAEDDLLDTATYGIAIALGERQYGDA